MREAVREPVGFQGLTLAMERWLHLGGHPTERMGPKLLAELVLKAALPASLLSSVKGGTPLVSAGITNGQGVLIEGVLTFFLVWVVFGTAVDPRGAFGRIAGLGIGFAVAMGLLMGAPFTGGAMNPARSFGPALVNGQWMGAWVYWVGPIIGGAAAALIYDTVNSRKQVV